LQSFLQPPFLTPDAAAAAVRAILVPVPVWLVGEASSGAYATARALHAASPPSTFVSVRLLAGSAGELEARLHAAVAASPTDAIALYVERIDRQLLAVQEALLAWIDEGFRWKERCARVRLVAQSDDARAARSSLHGSLRYRLTALVIDIPPLASRRNQVPAMAARLGRRAPDITEEAQRALAEHDWPGNVDELEARLTRALARSDAARLLASDLDLSTPPAIAAPAATSDAAAVEVRPEGPIRDRPGGSADLRALESMISQLAHEFKNPMVTIKTFAQHIDHLVGDDELRDKFSHLAGEAIERMDAYLDELTRFARFGPPSLRPVVLGQLVSRVLALSDPPIRSRVHANGIPPGVEVRVDEDQALYALRALVRALSRELPAEGGIVLDWDPSGELVLRSKATGVSRKLQALLDEGTAADSTGISLDFVLADALVRRGGGSMRTVRAGDQLEVHLDLPLASGRG
jgi:signal transduction histidine kinase